MGASTMTVRMMYEGMQTEKAAERVRDAEVSSVHRMEPDAMKRTFKEWIKAAGMTDPEVYEGDRMATIHQFYLEALKREGKLDTGAVA